MPRSQNGFTVIDPQDTVKWVIPGTDRHFILRPGPCGFILAHFALFFHEQVEPLDKERTWDDWGYAKRTVRGSTTVWSNHASGTALDLNAVQHPQGAVGTFDHEQFETFDRRLKAMRGVIKWGGDFNTVPDEMHWELVRGSVNDLAKELFDSPRGVRIRKANPHFGK